MYLGSEQSKMAASVAGGRKLGENKLLSKSAKTRLGPYDTSCKTCGSKTHHQGAKYCNKCGFIVSSCDLTYQAGAYEKGKCQMCGKKVLANAAAYKSTRS